ncbi:GIY-YIG nuclease family protein [Salipiger pacificus]|nr:GIY-YIG nuclease family protein [Alloyangia pacifica]
MTQPDHNISPAVPLAVTTPIPASWQQMARDKGFRLTRRGADRYQIMLECDHCGREHRSKRNVLMDHTPLCPHCIEQRWREDARSVGLELLHRDPDHHRHGFYRAACGHVIRRQFGRVRQIARGKHALRCETCLRQVEEAEARTAGWELLGPSPDRGSSYRRYRHSCGHVQEFARANMQTERICCGGCGVSWATAPSFIYCMRFKIPDSSSMTKLGFSKNPRSRLHHQLMCSPEIGGTILRTVAMSTGRAAQSLEKRMHGALKRTHPNAIIPPARYREHLRVKSEIYEARLEPTILAMLNQLGTGADLSV